MTTTPTRSLSLFDATALIVGIIIGAGIYETAPQIAGGAGSAWAVPLLWLAGGLLSLCGALCYAELASTWPREGGDVVYLSKAYGRWAGFLFGWLQLVVARPGDIALMAFVFATYACNLYLPLPGLPLAWNKVAYALTAVTGLTLINMLGVRQGKWTQNLLTVVKAAGLVGVVALALAAPPRPAAAVARPALPLSIALIMVLFTYGGWNEMAYVAAEVKQPRRNILRALVAGTVAVTALYLLVNAAFLYALGYAGLAGSKAVAVDAVAGLFPRSAGNLVSALVCLSALGAVNGLTFTGARITYALGRSAPGLGWLGRWHDRTGTPVNALLVQGLLAAGLILLLGSFLNAVIYTAAPVYCFYLASSLAVLVLRRRRPDIDRPFRAPLAAVLVFAAVCAFLIHAAVTYKPYLALAALGLLLLGLPVYALSARVRPAAGSPPHGPA